MPSGGLLSAALVSALLGAGLGSCGGAGSSTRSSSSAPTSTHVAPGGPGGGANSPVAEGIRHYGHPASPADAAAIAALVKRYYADAATDDGAKACALIFSVFEEAVAEDYGQAPGPVSLRGKTCAVVMSKFFRQVPGQPSSVLAATETTGARVLGLKGYALTYSKAVGPGYVAVQRELGSWKIQGLIGTLDTPRNASQGDANGSPASTPADANTPEGHGTDADDADGDQGVDDDGPIVEYGVSASPAQRRAIVVLVKRYYTAAAADDGARACAQIYDVVAETVPETFAESMGLHGNSCAAVMTQVLARRHRRMAADLAHFKVGAIRLGPERGYVMVDFGTRPAPYVQIHRQGDSWKVQSLLEIPLP